MDLVPKLPAPPTTLDGLGEKFDVSLTAGSASVRVPIPLPSAHHGFGPALALVFTSPSGRSLYGRGWTLPLACVERRTDWRLPKYDETDTFVLSGQDELVLAPDDVRDEGEFRVERLRPRVETTFDRVERWTHRASGEVHWRSLTADHTLHVFGRSPDARVTDPADPSRVLRWLLEESRSDRGAIVRYEYAREDRANVDEGALAELSRAGRVEAARHPKRVRWGNRTPDQADDFAFVLVFDYGDHDARTPEVEPSRPWPVRRDPYSHCRGGFDERTYRLCRRLLLFHHFDELGPMPVLVRAMRLVHDEAASAALLHELVWTGHADGVEASLPPLTFEYTEAQPAAGLESLDADAFRDLPGGPLAAQWIDLDGEGAPGLYAPVAGGAFYKRNLGDGRFGPLERVQSLSPLTRGAPSLGSLEGDGRREVVRFEPRLAGYQERTEEGFGPFVPFEQVPLLNWSDPRVKLVDLDGDGRTDVLVDEGAAWRIHYSRGRKGFAPPEVLVPPNGAPSWTSSDPFRIVKLADMTGDGLADVVEITRGGIAYWPNLGFGRFGAKITMDGAPLFGARFRPDRVRLVDTDGDGLPDLLYLGEEGVRIYRNQAGNGWSAAVPLGASPPIDDRTVVSVVDVRGRGTPCLLFASPLGAEPSVRVLDLVGDTPPGLLRRMTNHLGAELELRYAPAVSLYTRDRLEGRPWHSRTGANPSVVVEIVRRDAVTAAKATMSYRYRDAVQEHVEREARGFAFAETESREQFAATLGDGLFSDGAERALAPPTVVTRTWFDTGVSGEKQARLDAARVSEGYGLDVQASALAPRAIAPALPVDDEREAVRALRGGVVRQELFERDGSDKDAHPLVVVERSSEARCLLPHRKGVPAIVAGLPHETLTTTYEREPHDPRTLHELALEVDALGHVVRSASVAYPRRVPEEPEQARLSVVLTHQDVVHRLGPMHRLGAPIETRRFEARELATPTRFTVTSLNAALATVVEVALEAPVTTSPSLRLLACERQFYWDDDLSTPLPLGEVGSRALGHSTHTLAFSAARLELLLEGRATTVAVAGYVGRDEAWWTPSVTSVLEAANFFTPRAVIDPFGARTVLERDARALFAVRATDAVGNEVSVRIDYRHLTPNTSTDPNGHSTVVALDPLGRVVALAFQGRDGEGDTLAHPTAHFEMGSDEIERRGRPNFIRTRSRERHADPDSPWMASIVYLDGTGAEHVRKSQAEPGKTPLLEADGTLSAAREMDTGASLRWLVSSRTTRDARGSVVKAFAPYFTATPEFEPEAALGAIGLPTLARSDAMGRGIRTDRPDGTLSRSEIRAWSQAAWDANDTVGESRWLAVRQASVDIAEQASARRTLAHASTPTRTSFEPRGRTFLQVDDKGAGQTVATRFELDADGRQTAVIDALGRRAAETDYDLQGRALRSRSIDAGARWALPDVTGQLHQGWDARGYERTIHYDALRRPTHVFVSDAGGRHLVTRTFYGEEAPQDRNLRGRVHLQFDGAGLLVHERHDFRGRLVETTRRLARDTAERPDWTTLTAASEPTAALAVAAPLIEERGFVSRTKHDALDRPTELTLPDQSTALPEYTQRGLLGRLSVLLRGLGSPRPIVERIDYDVLGEARTTEFANQTRTRREVDPRSQRVLGIATTRADGARLQALRSTYDAVGNVTTVRDGAQETVFFGGAVVEPRSEFTYDALYRLVRAEGRENATSFEAPNERELAPRGVRNPDDGQALRHYTETYDYDGAGNVLRMVHRLSGQNGPGSQWTREYGYVEGSNRLASTTTGSDTRTFGYDAHGNTTRMPHLAHLGWDADDLMVSADLGGGGVARYAYDTAGERVRKVVARRDGLVRERIYLGDFELYRERRGDRIELERETLHLRLPGDERVASLETLIRDSSLDVATPGANARYRLGDMLGSTRVECDDAGQVLAFEEFHPYGTSAYRAGTGAVEANPSRYRYIDCERDEETSLSHHGLRSYAPWLGRWTSADPAGMVEGPNLYAYARDNPVSRRDRNGANSGEEEARRALEEKENRGGVAFGETEQGGYGLRSNAPDDWVLIKSNPPANSRTSQGNSQSPSASASSGSSKGPSASDAQPEPGDSLPEFAKKWVLLPQKDWVGFRKSDDTKNSDTSKSDSNSRDRTAPPLPKANTLTSSEGLQKPPVLACFEPPPMSRDLGMSKLLVLDEPSNHHRFSDFGSYGDTKWENRIIGASKALAEMQARVLLFPYYEPATVFNAHQSGDGEAFARAGRESLGPLVGSAVDLVEGEWERALRSVPIVGDLLGINDDLDEIQATSDPEKEGKISVSLVSRIINLIAAIWGARSSRRLLRALPAKVKLRPVEGRINVGGTGYEKGSQRPASNLNPVKPHTGGATQQIVNHVLGTFEQIGDLFEANSADSVIAERLRFQDLTETPTSLQKGASGSYKVMKPGGKLSMNIWTTEAAELELLKNAFERAGFRKVIIRNGTGSGTIVEAVR